MIILPPDMDILSPVDDHIFKTLLTHPNAKPVLIDVLSASIDRKVTDAVVRNNELPVSDDNEKGKTTSQERPCERKPESKSPTK